MTNATDGWRLSQEAVEGAIRSLAATVLTTTSDAMLRSFLAFKAVHAVAEVQPVDTAAIRSAVKELFEVLPTPPNAADGGYSGTLALRGRGDLPLWLRNDSYRGSFLDYVGPNSPGRFMFREGNWRELMLDDAVERVAETLRARGYGWPARDALAAVVLRNAVFDDELDWEALSEGARLRFGLSVEEWHSVTSVPTLEVAPFDGAPWEPSLLAQDLRPAGAEAKGDSASSAGGLLPRVTLEVDRVVEALEKHGDSAIVALAGVPGTSKSHVARFAARRFAAVECLREIQFHPGYTYEEFMEGPRYGDGMKVEVVPGTFMELNERALKNPDLQYVLLIEELTRADLPRVLGELLTYVEYRDETDDFTTMYRREPTRIAPNIAILATYNPVDQSAVSLDAALIRRLRVLDFPPNMEILREMLSGNRVDEGVADALVDMFRACREVAGDRFAEIMPFGHALFSSVRSESDLSELWDETIRRILVRPYAAKHELFDVIAEHYPWRTDSGPSPGEHELA